MVEQHLQREGRRVLACERERSVQDQTLERGFQKPLTLFGTRRQYYDSIDMRIAAVRVGDVWHNIRARILLTCETIKYKSEVVPECESFKMLREKLPIGQLTQVLTCMSKGELDIDKNKVMLWTSKDSTPPPNYENHCSRSSQWAMRQWGIPFPLDVFKLSQPNGLSSELEEVSQQLKCNRRPYADVFEAVNEGLELQDVYEFRRFDGHNESIAYILMPNYLAFDSAELKGNTLRVQVRFHRSTDVNHLRLNIIAKGKKTCRGQEKFSGTRTRKVAPYGMAETTSRLQGKPDVVLYLFELGGRSPADERLLLNEEVTNPYVAAHQQFDPELKTLERWLRGEVKDSADFEMSIAVLLHMCGFRVEWTGYDQMGQDAPDVLAFGPRSNLIVGECTTDLPDDKKIRMLAKRARQLRDKLRTEPLPVMFLGLSSEHSGTTVFQTAHQENVKVVTLDDLQQLRTYARREAPEEVLRYLRSLRH